MKCIKCDSQLLLPIGEKHSPVLILGYAPTYDEYQKGVHGSFGSAVHVVLRQELAGAGMAFESTRYTCMWGHLPNKQEADLEWNLKRALEEAKGRKAILLLGSELLRVFVPEHSKVLDVAGLKLSSHLLGKKLVMAAPHPSTVQHGNFGELRFALEKFVKLASKF